MGGGLDWWTGSERDAGTGQEGSRTTPPTAPTSHAPPLPCGGRAGERSQHPGLEAPWRGLWALSAIEK